MGTARMLRTGFLFLVVVFTMVAHGAQAQQFDDWEEPTGISRYLEQSAIPETPIDVQVGVRITQITGVDQKAENFSVVAKLQMEWTDPALVALLKEGQTHRTMVSSEFVRLARDTGIIVPAYVFENQQARGFTKQSTVFWTDAGVALHIRDEILTLQAPDFDFSDYPFDEQVFYVRVRALAPVEFVTFRPLEDFSGVGAKLGEEEWIIQDVWSEANQIEGPLGLVHSEYVLGLSADRHQIYYWSRIFLPLLLLGSVAWANLFLEDYRRRIDIASGNLLAFIALNFTISNELPRLGYLTFLDVFIAAMFVMSALGVGYNVALQRLAVQGRDVFARRMDWHVTIWVYPLVHAIIIGAIILRFDL